MYKHGKHRYIEIYRYEKTREIKREKEN